MEINVLRRFGIGCHKASRAQNRFHSTVTSIHRCTLALRCVVIAQKEKPPRRRFFDAELCSAVFGRGEKIRTSDPLHPMQVRYQAALRPDVAAIISERFGRTRRGGFKQKRQLADPCNAIFDRDYAASSSNTPSISRRMPA